MSTERELRCFKATGEPKGIAKMDLKQRVKWSLLSAGPCIQMMQETPRDQVSS
jgi:hypothetical protein